MTDKTLFIDSVTGQKSYANMEKIIESINRLNKKLHEESYVSLREYIETINENLSDDMKINDNFSLAIGFKLDEKHLKTDPPYELFKLVYELFNNEWPFARIVYDTEIMVYKPEDV